MNATPRAALLLCTLCLPAAVAVPALAVHVQHSTGVDRDRSAAVTAARQDVQDVLSFDYRTVAADIARARHEATGLFAQQYARSATQLATQARQTRAIVQATISSAGVVASHGDDVVVLLFVDQASVKQLGNGSAPSTRIDQSRVQVTMTRVDGRWLVAQLTAL